jgi:hypothetical protein
MPLLRGRLSTSKGSWRIEDGTFRYRTDARAAARSICATKIDFLLHPKARARAFAAWRLALRLVQPPTIRSTNGSWRRVSAVQPY